MLTLYYSPGLCSLVSHIVLEEIGEPYETKQILVSKGEQRTAAYLAVNPRGKVPALKIDNDVLTETVAILAYLARRYPAAQLIPEPPLEQAHCLSLIAWFTSGVHPSFTPNVRPERYAQDEAARAEVKAAARKTFWQNCRDIDTILTGKGTIMGAQYTVCDPYALLFYGWGLRIGLPMDELNAFTAFKERMILRPAVRKVLEREGSALLHTT